MCATALVHRTPKRRMARFSVPTIIHVLRSSKRQRRRCRHCSTCAQNCDEIAGLTTKLGLLLTRLTTRLQHVEIWIRKVQIQMAGYTQKSQTDVWQSCCNVMPSLDPHTI